MVVGVGRLIECLFLAGAKHGDAAAKQPRAIQGVGEGWGCVSPITHFSRVWATLGPCDHHGPSFQLPLKSKHIFLHVSPVPAAQPGTHFLCVPRLDVGWRSCGLLGLWPRPFFKRMFLIYPRQDIEKIMGVQMSMSTVPAECLALQAHSAYMI